MPGRFESSPSSTTSPANAWRSSPIPRSRGFGFGRELDAIIAERSKPIACVSDNGTELTSMAILRWSQKPASTALHRPRQTTAECFYRELQWSPARRAFERNPVCLASPCPGDTRAMEARLHHHPAAQQHWKSGAGRLCQAQRPGIATGRDAARNRGLRAPSRCSTEPGRLKWPIDSTHRWIRKGAQVSGDIGSRPPARHRHYRAIIESTATLASEEV